MASIQKLPNEIIAEIIGSSIMSVLMALYPKLLRQKIIYILYINGQRVTDPRTSASVDSNSVLSTPNSKLNSN
jgi:hypothetical protein